MKEALVELPPKYAAAVRHWCRHWIPDWDWMSDNWSNYFPEDQPVCLCARMELETPEMVHIGEHTGQKKRLKPSELTEEEAHQLLSIIRAQASTECGSIQQHAMTIEQAPTDQDRIWTLRVAAEELRHAVQMIHLSTSADWGPVAEGVTGDDIVEGILSMQTGSHILDAFNLKFDSFLDNITFAAIIDRVGKFQLTMQKVCAYKPMADSMPPMLREEAFHLAAGVVPLRRAVARAAAGDPFVTMQTIQRAINKWYPRGLEMFGDERGGETNIKYGFKDMKNREAQDLYIEELERMIRDLNIRFLRARFPSYSPEKVDDVLTKLLRNGGNHQGVEWSDLLALPDRSFFRRKGEPAWGMVNLHGQAFPGIDYYLPYLAGCLPEAYLASRDMQMYTDMLRRVAAGELTPVEATKKMPRLKRVGGTCPCSGSVRWVVEQPARPN